MWPISRMWNHELRKLFKGKYHLEFVQLIHYVNSIFTLSKITSSTIPYVLRNVLIKSFYVIYESFKSNLHEITLCNT